MTSDVPLFFSELLKRTEQTSEKIEYYRLKPIWMTDTEWNNWNSKRKSIDVIIRESPMEMEVIRLSRNEATLNIIFSEVRGTKEKINNVRMKARRLGLW